MPPAVLTASRKTGAPSAVAPIPTLYFCTSVPTLALVIVDSSVLRPLCAGSPPNWSQSYARAGVAASDNRKAAAQRDRAQDNLRGIVIAVLPFGAALMTIAYYGEAGEISPSAAAPVARGRVPGHLARTRQ